ncbi:succinyl-CoA ligase, putative [Eimeria acervulina]|uniref:Succinyl-CoA ligase, putative n=1 Tax=Eimeria acervulina TaxID=5801 RepID=U6GSQ2_EIMAC|nr:succinyl-CoA ligase, putative [Eimeria acervulina]CDI83210.1 succinyl-CoA ligase, putative [Eimeria acervulina]
MNTLLRLGGSRGPLQLRPASPLCWRAAGAGGLLQQQQQQQLQQQRHLSLHEYQALQLLREFNVPMPMFSAAHTPEEAYTAAVQMQQQQQQQQQKGSKGVVVKAQVLAGGRGLGAHGGTSIEDIAKSQPDSIVKIPIDAEKGLAMATMDLLTLKGGNPANFLDVGGAAQQQQITQALHLLQTDTQVKAIFINIFGGIMKCDLIAKGLIEAAKTVHITKPLVVRLEGTNKEQAETLLADAFKTAAASGQQQLHLEAVSDLDAAAARAVELAAQQK